MPKVLLANLSHLLSGDNETAGTIRICTACPGGGMSLMSAKGTDDRV